jgi:hypothetical protein
MKAKVEKKYMHQELKRRKQEKKKMRKKKKLAQSKLKQMNVYVADFK